MIQKYKTPLVFFLLGIAITILGSLFKIMHWSLAPSLLVIGMGLEVIAIFILIFVILKSK